MKRPLAAVALCAMIGPHAAAQPAPGLTANCLSNLEQCFDRLPAQENGVLAFVPGQRMDLGGMKLEIRIGTWKPEPRPAPYTDAELLDLWIAHERPRAGQMPIAIHSFTSGSGVKGPLLWFDRPPGVSLGPVEHITLGALPRADGSLETYSIVGSGTFTGHGHPLPLRCLDSFDVNRFPGHGSRVVKSMDAGYSITLPFDWTRGGGETCGNSYMMTDETRRHSFYPSSSFIVINKPNDNALGIHTTFMEDPPAQFSRVASDDKWSGDGKLQEFTFDDGEQGLMKSGQKGDYQSSTYYRTLGHSMLRIMSGGGKDADMDRAEAVVRTIRPVPPDTNALDTDGRATHSCGFYRFTHKPEWIVADAEYTYMGSVNGDCAVCGPRHGNPKSESGMHQVSLIIHAQPRFDTEATDAIERAAKPVQEAATIGAGLKTETTDDSIRTGDGTQVRRQVGRMTIAENPSSSKRLAAAKNLGFFPRGGVTYAIHAPDGVTDLIATSQLQGPEIDSDLAEMDRIVTSIRFKGTPQVDQRAKPPTPPNAVR